MDGRSLAFLLATFVATGGLWSGAEDLGIAFGAICGALVFAVVIGGSLLLSGRFPGQGEGGS
jgi:hypothetical protein